MSKETNIKNTKRVAAWVCMALAVAFTAYAFVAKSNYWPGASISLMLIPVWVMLFVVGVVILRSETKKKYMSTNSTLLVDYRVRYLIGKTMRAKRRVAWMLVIAGAIAIICVPVGLLFFEDNGLPLVFVLLPAAVVFVVIGVVTVNTSRMVEKALSSGNQAVFNHAMARWAFRCRLANWCYLLFPVATFLLFVSLNYI